MTATNISMRVEPELLDRIDASASQAGQTRTDYILSWLPDTYDRNTNTSRDNAADGTRGVS